MPAGEHAQDPRLLSTSTGIPIRTPFTEMFAYMSLCYTVMRLFCGNTLPSLLWPQPSHVPTELGSQRDEKGRRDA